MNLEILCGIMGGIAISLIIFICVMRWKAGRAVRKGRRGEKVVAKELRRLKSRDNIIIHDILISNPSGRSSQVDHIVVSRRGIFVIETKSLEGRISGTEYGQYWQQHLPAQSRQFYNPLLQNTAHIRNLRRIVPGASPEWWISVIVFTEAGRLDIRADDLVRNRRLWWGTQRIRRTLIPAQRRQRRWWCPWKEIRLDDHKIVLHIDGLIDEISRRRRIVPKDSLEEIASAIRNGTAEEPGARKAHVAYAREVSRQISSGIRRGVCPRCGGELRVIKKDGYEFAGCSNYPDCRFTCSIDRLQS